MDARSFAELKPNPNIPPFRPGDTVRVHSRVIEGDRERIQAFEGVVLRIRRGGSSSNFTVRRISHGVGVERIFPYFSPLIEKVDVMRVGRVRRAKLYYLRRRVGKGARIKAGSRARFEALTAGAAPEMDEYKEEEALAEEKEEEGAAGESIEEEEALAAELPEEAPAEAPEAADMLEEEEPAEGKAVAGGQAAAVEEPAAEETVEDEAKA